MPELEKNNNEEATVIYIAGEKKKSCLESRQKHEIHLFS
jgi:hypothetical protein